MSDPIAVGSFYVPAASLEPSSSSSTAVTPESPSSLLGKIHRLAALVPLTIKIVPAVQSAFSSSPVEGAVHRIFIQPDRPIPPPSATPTNGKGKGRALGKKQLQQLGRKRGALLADLLTRLSGDVGLWNGEVDLNEDGQLREFEPVLDPQVVFDPRSLQEVYSSLPSPSPSTVTPFASVESQEFKAVARLLEDVVPDLPGMKSTLKGYQVNDVKQMALCELASPPMADLDYLPVRAVATDSSRTPDTYYVSFSTGAVSSCVDFFEAPRGGVLCENMGLGKTVCVLALILATKSQRAGPPAGIPIRTEWLDGQVQAPPEDGMEYSRVPRLSNLAAHTLLASSFRGLHPSTMDDPDALPPDVQTLLRQLGFRHQNPFYWAPAKQMRGRSGANEVYREVRILLGWGSLVIVPDNLLNQWASEIEKHLWPEALRTLVVSDDTSDLPSREELAHDYDLVLLSHSRFARENSTGSLDSMSTTSRPCRCYALRDDGERCICAPPASPLIRIRWKRLVVDEGHVASSKMSDLVRVASLLPAERVWVVTGTPTPNMVKVDKPFSSTTPTSQVARAWPSQARGDISRLQAMCDFLKLGSLSESSWTSLIAGPFRLGLNEVPDAGAVARLDALLQRLMIRHRPEDQDAKLPPLHKSKVSLSLSSESTITFNVLLSIMNLNSVKTARGGDGWIFSSYNSTSLQRLFSNMSYSAFWLSSPTFFEVASKHWEALTEKEDMEMGNRIMYTHEDDQALRAICAHLQRGATDRDWQTTVGSFGSSLPARIRGLDDRLARAWGAVSPSGWTDHLALPSKLLRMRSAAARYFVNNPEAEAEEVVAYLVEEGRNEREEEVKAARRQEAIAAGKQGLQKWWKSDDFADSQRMAKAKKRAVVATDPFPTTPIVPPNFPLLDARLVSTASTKLNWVISEILRYGEDEKFLVFSRDASALGLLTELLDCVGVPADYVGGILTKRDRQSKVSSFETGSDVRVLLLELNQGARGLNLASASRIIFCEPVPSSDLERQALGRAHRLGQTKDVHVKTLLASGTFEESVSEQHASARPRASTSKTAPKDYRVADLLNASDFLSVDPTPVNLLPSFDVPFWLSGTHFQTKRKMDAGMLSRPKTQNLANNSLRRLAPVRSLQQADLARPSSVDPSPAKRQKVA